MLRNEKGKDGSVVKKPLQKLTLYNVNITFFKAILEPTLFTQMNN